MSVIDILRKRRFWIALVVSVIILLILWAIGALLIVKGSLPQDVLTGWVCGSYLAAGLAGGVLAGRKENGGMTIALMLAVLMILISILAAWILYGGVSLADGGWKTMVFTLFGAALAGTFSARKGKGKVRRRGHKRR